VCAAKTVKNMMGTTLYSVTSKETTESDRKTETKSEYNG